MAGSQGFEVVEYRKVTGDTLDAAMDYFAEAVTKNNFPSDGLVALYDNIAYGESLGTTAKFPRNAMAFNGGQRCVIRSFWRLSGARQERLINLWPSSILWSLKVPQSAEPVSTTSVS